MVEATADELTTIVEHTGARLLRLNETAVGVRPALDAWSIKEILGHLVDSAANNHQRFVRAQEADRFAAPGYAQEHWVTSQGYQDRPWAELVELWRLYNRHLAHVMRRIPMEKRAVACVIGSDDPVTLEFLVDDYLVHLKHHLEQIRALA